MTETRAGLGVLVDGAPMPDEEARALWERFSSWMEDHPGDLAGFAKLEGFASVQPGVDGGRAVLRASHHAPQTPYRSVGGGSTARQGTAASNSAGGSHGSADRGSPQKRRR